MREFRPEIADHHETTEMRERERVREEFLRPARAFQKCIHTLFANGALPPNFTEHVAQQYRLDDNYRYALSEFAEFSRIAGEKVDTVLSFFEEVSGPYTPDDRLLAQTLTGITSRHPCDVDPHALGFTVRYTHPSDYLRQF